MYVQTLRKSSTELWTKTLISHKKITRSYHNFQNDDKNTRCCVCAHACAPLQDLLCMSMGKTCDLVKTISWDLIKLFDLIIYLYSEYSTHLFVLPCTYVCVCSQGRLILSRRQYITNIYARSRACVCMCVCHLQIMMCMCTCTCVRKHAYTWEEKLKANSDRKPNPEGVYKCTRMSGTCRLGKIWKLSFF